MAKPRTSIEIKQSVARENSARSTNRWEPKVAGKLVMTRARDRVVPREMQAKSISEPQFRNDQHGPGYCPDVPDGWLRGSRGKATNKPYFDHSPNCGKERR